MGDFLLGEIKLWPVNWVPDGWALCNGQELSIQQNTALYSLIGTLYGGNGQTTFALPNLAGKVPLGTTVVTAVAQKGGQTSVQLQQANLPQITVQVQAANAAADSCEPVAGASLAVANDPSSGSAPNIYKKPTSPQPPMVTLMAGQAGGTSQAINVQNPYLTMNYIICTVGIYPSRP